MSISNHFQLKQETAFVPRSAESFGMAIAIHLAETGVGTVSASNAGAINGRKTENALTIFR